MSDLKSQLEAARLTHEAITQGFEPPAFDIEAAAIESAHDRQPAQGLHYLNITAPLPSVAAMTYPSVINDYYQQQGVHFFEGDAFWPSD